jgi:hypothetical protein
MREKACAISLISNFIVVTIKSGEKKQLQRFSFAVVLSLFCFSFLENLTVRSIPFKCKWSTLKEVRFKSECELKTRPVLNSRVRERTIFHSTKFMEILINKLI